VIVKTDEGRELCVEVAGDGSAGTVLVCAGTPNSRHLYSRWVDDAVARGLRLVGYDRPGYGGSTPHPGRTVADGAAEVRSIAQSLGVDSLLVWGFSGGGPYALACAALLPDLVRAAAAVCSVAPWEAPGLDYFTGMGEDNVEDIKLMLDDPDAARRKCAQDREELMAVTAEGIVESWKTLLSPVDASALRGDFATFLANGIHDGLAPGEQGWWDDGVAHMAPWGFELDTVRVPVKIWHGRQDRFVPFQHGEWLAANVAGAEADLSETDGHLTLLIDKVPDIHAWLAGHLG
jgi:pimeloyl-ACP methyl ester carboxylesterase